MSNRSFRCKSFRVYVYLVLGMTVGILLSSTLQILALFPAAAVDDTKPFQTRELHVDVPSNTMTNDDPSKDNAMQTSKNKDKPAQPGGDTVSKDYPLEENLDVADMIMDNRLIEEEILKKQVYMDQNWQGRRNIQDLHNPSAEITGNPVLKLSEELPTRKPLLIAVITSIQQLMSQTIAIHGTWGKNEKEVIYFVGEVRSMPHLPHGMEVVQLEGIDDKLATWEMKEMAVFKHIVSQYSETIDWLLITGDDVYVKIDALRKRLSNFRSTMTVYLGYGKQTADLCDTASGVIYSMGLMSRLEPYLPQCLGEELSLGNCIGQRGIKCTRAQETRDLFYMDHTRLLETGLLYSSRQVIQHALTLYPIRYPKFMYRLHNYIQEIKFNASISDVQSIAKEMESTLPFIPTYLQSQFKPSKNPLLSSSCKDSSSSEKQTQPTPQTVNVHPRYMPKNKFEVNNWDYFNQTRLMAINSEQPSHGIIGGVREEARYALTKGIFLANAGASPADKLIFDKLENGYHRVDPMRGSEFILDFVFRKNVDKSVRVRKRIGLLRPFHDTVVPVDTPKHLPRVNFIITLSGLSERLDQFLKAFERNVLIPNEDASLTISLYNTPDAGKVRDIMSQYKSMYPKALLNVVDIDGVFARGVGLDHGTKGFSDNDLIFFVDIDLEIGPDFIHRARLNTIQGKQVYLPIFFKLYKPDFVQKYYKGNSSQVLARHKGHWAHYSYGMVVIYTSDYRKVGGFDTDIKGWGEEDVNFFKKILSHGLEVFRAPDPGLIHLWHPKICNKDTVTTQDAYAHCLQSKSENLADRVELAQYVFENELKNSPEAAAVLGDNVL